MPTSYIVFYLMKILKEHGKVASLSEKQIGKVISLFLEEAYLSEEEKDSLVNDFDFDGDMETLLSNYGDFISYDDGMITLSPYKSIQSLDALLDEISECYDDVLIGATNVFLYFNISIFEILNIKVNIELCDRLIKLVKDVEEEYKKLAICEINSEIINEIKTKDLGKKIILRMYLFNQMKHNLTLVEYEDLHKYLERRVEAITSCDELELKIDNEFFCVKLKNDLFLRALFFIDDDAELALHKLFYQKENCFDEALLNSKKVFYLKVLDVINDRINKKEYNDVDRELIATKYRLMHKMDMLYQDDVNYNGYLFMGNKANFTDSDIDFSFIEDEVFYLIDEILEYTDYEMKNGFGYDYENAVKSILIETYYELTKDRCVIDSIKNNPNYGKNRLVTELFDNIIPSGKKKVKRKED